MFPWETVGILTNKATGHKHFYIVFLTGPEEIFLKSSLLLVRHSCNQSGETWVCFDLMGAAQNVGGPFDWFWELSVYGRGSCDRLLFPRKLSKVSYVSRETLKVGTLKPRLFAYPSQYLINPCLFVLFLKPLVGYVCQMRCFWAAFWGWKHFFRGLKHGKFEEFFCTTIQSSLSKPRNRCENLNLFLNRNSADPAKPSTFFSESDK